MAPGSMSWSAPPLAVSWTCAYTPSGGHRYFSALDPSRDSWVESQVVATSGQEADADEVVQPLRTSVKVMEAEVALLAMAEVDLAVHQLVDTEVAVATSVVLQDTVEKRGYDGGGCGNPGEPGGQSSWW
ncbi:MAG: hypothetical protein M1827_000837 [Pycnora praestabilis]|nr:MAG: hypothetical protein M1827_000837 [Pycnora praestabilis]